MMKCPICSAELKDGAISCPTCRARQVLRRTRLGVATGWAGILFAVHAALGWIPLPLMLMAGFDVRRVPWQLAAILVVITILAVATLWHSNSTKHLEWVDARD